MHLPRGTSCGYIVATTDVNNSVRAVFGFFRKVVDNVAELFNYGDSYEPAADAIVARIPRRVRTKPGLLAHLGASLRFPDYFGHNWDALEECLGDLSWWPDDRKLVVVHEALPLRRGSQEQVVYLQILQATLAYWEPKNPTRLTMVFPTHEQATINRLLRVQ